MPVAENPADASGTVLFARISTEPISVIECMDAVGSNNSGAIASFSGVIRDHDHDRDVARLSYSAHPTASEVLREVAHDVALAHPDCRIAIAHRIGDLAVGDLALACAVAAAHRSEAFAACAFLVDEVKSRVPIWKEQIFTDGSTEWVGVSESQE